MEKDRRDVNAKRPTSRTSESFHEGLKILEVDAQIDSVYDRSLINSKIFA